MKESLLEIYYTIWRTGNFPEGWREALTIPIPKPGKDPENLDSYRPISLTSCLGKIMEKMVNKTLVHILEKRRLIPEQQYGFRSDRSTTDVLNILQSKISHSLLPETYDLSRKQTLKTIYSYWSRLRWTYNITDGSKRTKNDERKHHHIRLYGNESNPY
jgi:Reverse transcriptase (RNA-dependent DNA polymerase)